ncbi:MAG: acid phosphatase [Alphaproteobacteria bacterium]|nr:MAG: acid phosphatase [Alphaproteobacteria bacterium]
MRTSALKLACLLGATLAAGGCSIDQGPTIAEDCGQIPWPDSLPVYDHIVILVEENKDNDLILGPGSFAPYINETLKPMAANFTQAYGEEHHSQGNYFWLFAGDNHVVGFEDENVTLAPGYPFSSRNVGSELIDKGYTFKGYAQSLPEIGSTVWETENRYARKHVPWIAFSNVPNGDTVETSSNLRFKDFPTTPEGFTQLPTVSFVIPDLVHDMHDGVPEEAVALGDTWLQNNLGAYVTWAQDNNSLFILTFDENSDMEAFKGLTDPASEDISVKNQIATLMIGDHVKPGDYAEGPGINHVTMLRTIEAMYGLCRSGAQLPSAVHAGISDDMIITDIFQSEELP